MPSQEPLLPFNMRVVYYKKAEYDRLKAREKLRNVSDAYMVQQVIKNRDAAARKNRGLSQYSKKRKP